MDIAAIVALFVVVGFVVLVVMSIVRAPRHLKERNAESGERLFGAGQFRLEPKAAGSDTVVVGRYRDEDLYVYFERYSKRDWTFLARPGDASWLVVQVVKPYSGWKDTRLQVVESGLPEIDKDLSVRTNDAARAETVLRRPSVLRAMEVLRSLSNFSELQAGVHDPRPAPDAQHHPRLVRMVLSDGLHEHSPEQIDHAVEALDLFRQALAEESTTIQPA